MFTNFGDRVQNQFLSDFIVNDRPERFWMLFGDVSIEGAPTVIPFLYIVSFMTSIMCLVESQGPDAPWLLIFHSLLGWPTMTEVIMLTFCLWAFRGVERILGEKLFRNFMLYNLIAYLPFYLFFMIYFKWFNRISLLYFYPYALFIFVLCHIPSTEVYLIITDKILVTLAFVLTMAVQVPYSLVPFGCTILGNLMWSYDVIGLLRCTKETIAANDGAASSIPQPEYDHDNHHHTNSVRALVDMGFNEFDAIQALRRTRNNVNRAIEHLLTH